MKTLEEYNDIRFPAYALSYVVNNDASGLDDKDIEAVDKFMAFYYQRAEKLNGHVIFSIQDMDQEEYFTWRAEFGLACNVVDCVILIVN